VSDGGIRRWWLPGLAFISTAAFGLILWILVPVQWNTLRIVEAGGLLLMYLSTWLLPQWLWRRGSNDAGALGSIGPTAAISTLYLGLGASAFSLSLFDQTRLSEAAFVAATAVWIGGMLLLRLSSRTIQDVAESADKSLESQKLVATLSRLVPVLSDQTLRKRINLLIDSVRYGPTPSSASTLHAASICSLAKAVQEKAVGSQGDTSILIAQLEDAVHERKAFLMQSRSRI